MKLINIKNFGGLILGGALLLGSGLASTTAQAQYPNRGQDQYRRDRDDRGQRGRSWDGYRNYGGTYELRQTALNAGYNEGAKAGRNDRQHNRRNEFRDSSSYQKADKDYSSRLGDRETYEQYFRDAFENGYHDGYIGY